MNTKKLAFLRIGAEATFRHFLMISFQLIFCCLLFKYDFKRFRREGCLELPVVSDSQLLDAFRHHSPDAFLLFDTLSDFRAADVEQWSFYDGNAFWYIAYAGSLARINHDGIVG